MRNKDKQMRVIRSDNGGYLPLEAVGSQKRLACFGRKLLFLNGLCVFVPFVKRLGEKLFDVSESRF